MINQVHCGIVNLRMEFFKEKNEKDDPNHKFKAGQTLAGGVKMKIKPFQNKAMNDKHKEIDDKASTVDREKRDHAERKVANMTNF